MSKREAVYVLIILAVLVFFLSSFTSERPDTLQALLGQRGVARALSLKGTLGVAVVFVIVYLLASLLKKSQG